MCMSANRFFKNPIIIIGVIFLMLNCSRIHYSENGDCDFEDEDCLYGNTDLFYKPPMDILFVFDNTKDIKTLNPSINSNLNSFLECIEPMDWRVGIIVSGKTKGGGGEIGNIEGRLIHFELAGELLPIRHLTAEEEYFSQIFSDSISLGSRCDLPPYCGSGLPRSLTVLNTFMGNPQTGSYSFLREETPLTTVIISSTDKNDKAVSAHQVLSSVHYRNGYYNNGNHFMNVTITPDGTEYDCITTTRDIVSKGIDIVSTGASLWSVFQFDPIILGGSILLRIIKALFAKKPVEERQAEKMPQNRVAIVDFAYQSGGYYMDLCKPDYGRYLALVMLERLNRQDELPEKCRTVRMSGKDFETIQHIQSVDSI